LSSLELFHFTATWAVAICAPHRGEVATAAKRLGTDVREVDVDEEANLVRDYGVLNVPALAIEGRPSSLVVGAFAAEDLVDRLSLP
jgi:hypothetical protein